MNKEKPPPLTPEQREWLREEVNRRRREYVGLKCRVIGKNDLTTARIYLYASEGDSLDAVSLAADHAKAYK